MVYEKEDHELQVQQNAKIDRNTKITIVLGVLSVLATLIQTVLDFYH